MNTDRKVILAVDDASPNLQIIHALLNKDFDLRLAKSGEMALDAMRRVMPDLVLLDIEMPGMSGLKVLERMMNMQGLRHIPVILVTVHATREFVVEAHKLGARDYLVKPFEPEQLRAKIDKILSEE